MPDFAAPATPARILLVDPDETAAAPLASALAGLGYRVVRAADARGATVAMSEQAFDLILLERILPGSDGVALLRWMRSEHVHTPVILLTALGRSEERVEGLESGADDYVVKPHDLPELNARIRTVLRRASPRRDSDRATLTAGDITLSLLGHRAFRGGQAIDLHNTELRLLAELVRARGDAITREALLDRVWGSEAQPATNIVEAYVRRLRMKLDVPGLPDPIVTLRGVGYKLRI